MYISILHYASPPIVGGVESTIYHHARRLFNAGFSVSIYGGRGDAIDDHIPFILIPEIDSRHPRVLEISEQLSKGEVTQDFIQLRDELVSKLLDTLKHSDKLIVHNAITLHKNLPLTAALKIISEHERPELLAWCHDFAWQDKLYTPDLHSGYPWDLLKTIWKGVTYVAVSEHRQQRLADLLNMPASRIRVIPPGIDLTEFLEISPLGQEFIERYQIFDREPVMLLPARITRRKNIEFAIRVTASLKKTFPKVCLIITGPPGPHNPKNIKYLENLLGLKSSLQLDANVLFIYEFKGHDQVFSAPDNFISELYRISDLVIFPSFREGFGIPVLEAGIARAPIFASDIPPVQESSAGMITLFDPQDDPEHVAGLITSHIQASQSYQLRRHVLNHFTWDSIVKNKIIPLLESSGETVSD